MRAVKIPVTMPHAWMARLVKNVPKLALEKIIGKSQRRELARANYPQRLPPRDHKPDTNTGVADVKVIQDDAKQICSCGARLRFGILDHLPGCVSAFHDQDRGVRHAGQYPAVRYIQ